MNTAHGDVFFFLGGGGGVQVGYLPEGNKGSEV